MRHTTLISCLTWLVASSAAQRLLQAQNSTWNSTYSLSEAQIRGANLSAATVQNVEVAINFERTNQAGGDITNDRFYDVPSSYDPTNPPPPGTILKVEENTNTTFYTLPPTVSMSRILYVSETLNGSSVPASAYILWPYVPREFKNLKSCRHGKKTDDPSPVYPIIAYPHGTSGYNTACAPSSLRSLWDSWQKPFSMALQGYAVIAPDYAGLGVQDVASPYFVLPAQAEDLLHAVTASQTAFPDNLSQEFVIAGHSLGGGAAWASAERLVSRPMEGYLGTVAASPFLDILDDIAGQNQAQVNGRVAAIAQGLGSVYPTFELSDWMTDAGIARLELLTEVGGCNAVSSALFSAEGLTIDILREGWEETEAALWYNEVASNGGEQIAGPMLVIQGTEDGNAILEVTTAGVESTCEAYPESKLEYVIFEGLGHVPVLFGGMHIWMDWIGDRFKGRPVKEGCETETVGPVRGVENIVPGINWFMSYNVYGV